jgi:hypothetical protein
MWAKKNRIWLVLFFFEVEVTSTTNNTFQETPSEETISQVNRKQNKNQGGKKVIVLINIKIQGKNLQAWKINKQNSRKVMRRTAGLTCVTVQA